MLPGTWLTALMPGDVFYQKIHHEGHTGGEYLLTDLK